MAVVYQVGWDGINKYAVGSALTGKTMADLHPHHCPARQECAKQARLKDSDKAAKVSNLA